MSANSRTTVRRLLNRLQLTSSIGTPCVLTDFKSVGPFRAWMQAVVVVTLFVVTVLYTHDEYMHRGTCFGFTGPASMMLFIPIIEELIFRGWILSQFCRRIGPWPSIAWSSALFGLVHLRNIFFVSPEELLRMMAWTGLVLGPILGYITLRCGTVWPAVIFHYLNNLAYYIPGSDG